MSSHPNLHLRCAASLAFMALVVLITGGCGDPRELRLGDPGYQHPLRSVPGRFYRKVKREAEDGSRETHFIELMPDHTYRYHVDTGPGPNRDLSRGHWSAKPAHGVFVLTLTATSGAKQPNPYWYGIGMIYEMLPDDGMGPEFLHSHHYPPGSKAFEDR